MDWKHPPKASDLYHTPNLDLEPTGKENEAAQETSGAAIWKLKQRGLVIPGDNLRSWPRIWMPGELM